MKKEKQEALHKATKNTLEMLAVSASLYKETIKTYQEIFAEYERFFNANHFNFSEYKVLSQDKRKNGCLIKRVMGWSANYDDNGVLRGYITVGFKFYNDGDDRGYSSNSWCDKAQEADLELLKNFVDDLPRFAEHLIDIANSGTYASMYLDKLEQD